MNDASRIGSQSRLALEIGQEMIAHRALVRNFECHVQTVDRVNGLVHGRDRAFGDTPLDTVLAEFLPCFERHALPVAGQLFVAAPV